MRHGIALGTAVVMALSLSVTGPVRAQTPLPIEKRIAEAEIEGATWARASGDQHPRKCLVIRPEQIVFPTGTATSPYLWSGDFDAASISFGWDKTYEQAKMPLRALHSDAIGDGLKIRLIRLEPPGEGPTFSLAGFNARTTMTNEPFFASWPKFPTPGKWMMLATAGVNWGCFVLDRPVKATGSR